MWLIYTILVLVGLLGLVAVHDLIQKKHAILRNFPIIGHFRYILEAIGPELRQYIVTDNDEERPFTRDQRRWVYASSKKENNYFGFGTDNDLELKPNYLVIKHSAFPLDSPQPGDADYDPKYNIPCAKVMGEFRNRKKAFRPKSIINVSGMSFGSLSAQAIEAVNRGCGETGSLHNTGEGGISPYHLHGGDLIWQIGTGYFGCRELDGTFSLDRLKRAVEEHPSVRAVELKLSQGAKPGAGGILPRKKITPEIALIRGITNDKDCVSPSAHRVFRDPDSLLDFIEMLGEETGLPIGIKSAVGDMGFWNELADLIQNTNRSPDFIAVDGGEGGTGAAPLAFSDHISMPFKIGFSRVFQTFRNRGLQNNIVFIGSGKLGFPETSLFAFALGCDLIAVAREPMLAIGCIQAQRCHTNHCPTGVATQNPWLVRGLDPQLKGARLANYIIVLRKELLAISRACGVCHPALIHPTQFEVLDARFGAATVGDLFGYPKNGDHLSDEQAGEIRELMNFVA